MKFGVLYKNATEGKGLTQVQSQNELANYTQRAAEIDGSQIGLEVASDIRNSSPAAMAAAARAKTAKEQAEKEAQEAKRQEAEADKRRAETERTINAINKPDEDAARQAWAEKKKQDDAKEAEKKKQETEAERQRKATEAGIDKTGVEGAAFGMFEQINGLKGKQRRNANAQADAAIQQMVREAAAMNPDINAVQAREMAAKAPEFFRRRYAEQLAKQRAAMQAGQGPQGRGFHSVAPNGPEVDDAGDEPRGTAPAIVAGGAPGGGGEADELAANQRRLAANQQAGARQTGQLASAATETTNAVIRAEQYIRSVDPILRTLHQRQRTMQLWGR
jgi:hypothetical protein